MSAPAGDGVMADCGHECCALRLAAHDHSHPSPPDRCRHCEEMRALPGLLTGTVDDDGGRRAAIALLTVHGFWLRHPGFARRAVRRDGNRAFIDWSDASGYYDEAMVMGQVGDLELLVLDLAITLAKSGTTSAGVDRLLASFDDDTRRRVFDALGLAGR